MSDKKRKRLRISLRALLIALTVFCVLLGWWTYRAQKQREAVKWARSKGDVVYDYEMRPHGSWKPSWWHKMFGIDYFENVYYVRLLSWKTDDLSALGNLRNVKILDIRHCMHVADFSPLSSMRSLEELKAAKSGLRDLKLISGLANLHSLDLQSTQIDDLTPLIQLNKLVNLNIGNTSIDNLQPITSMPSLEYVNVRGTNIPIEDIMRLRKALPDCLIAY